MNPSLTIRGISVRGNGRGRRLGFPTANIVPNDSSILLKPGVYAAWVHLDQAPSPHKAAIHIGPRPTFDDDTPTIEIHLLDFPDRDLYGHHFKISQFHYLRQVKKFPSPKALSTALIQDCDQAEKVLG